MFVQKKSIRVAPPPFVNGNIEVRERRTGFGDPIATAPLNYMYMADFALDLTTFKVLKNRHGHRDLSATEAHAQLTECIERGERVLLLV